MQDRRDAEGKAKQDAHAGGTKVTDATPEFEEYTAPPRLDEKGRPLAKPAGLKASGYQFPPKDPGAPQPPLTKANLAKGIGVPDLPRAAPAATGGSAWPVPALPGQRPSVLPPPEARTDKPPAPPPVEMVDDTGLFEEYQRPGLKQNPRTGKGLRTEPSRPSASEILSAMKEPEIEVAIPKKFSIYEPPSSKPKLSAQEEDAARLDALADLASAAPNAVMSNPVANGPITTVIHHDEGHREEQVAPAAEPAPPPSPEPAPSPARREAGASSQPHAPDAPRPGPGIGCRIGLVQGEFNLAITDAMATAARREVARLDCAVAALARVPGAFDVPLAVQRLLQRPDVDAVVAIGCVIQGETGHDELIAHATAKSLQELALRFGKPVGLAITGPRMTEAQAWARVEAAAFAVGSVAAQVRAVAPA